jgi:hypothetical protein
VPDTRPYRRGIQSLFQRWTPGQYDRLSDQNGYPGANMNHMRRYSFRRARSQILVPGLVQLLITCILIAGLAGTFGGYAKQQTLDTNQRHIYNFLMTGLIIALTINLTSSMRSYVQVLRWRLLAASSLSLAELDLALDCASQTKTLKLLLLYTWRERRLTRVQVLCVAWILLNLGSAVVTGLLGLTQEFDPVTALVRRTGPVWVADFSSILSIDSGSQYATQRYTVNAYGVQASQDYFIQVANDALTATYPGEQGDLICPQYSTYMSNCIYVNGTDSFAAYRLNIMNAEEYRITGAMLYNKSSFSVKSTAVCSAYTVLNDLQTQEVYFNYTDNEGHSQQLYVPTWANGCVTYISDSNSSCGPRCTRVLALQAAQLPDNNASNTALNITSSTIFDCNNTVSQIHNLTSGKTAEIPFNDNQAKLVAGAIGWTGFVNSTANTSNTGTREYHLYPYDTYWSPANQIRTKDTMSNEFINNENDFTNQPGMEALIQQFSMYAIAAYDDNGGQTEVISPLMPISSVRLHMLWKYATPVLVIIPAIQFMFLIAVALWANNAVVRSDSVLSTARLLMPLLDHLKNERRRTGSVLTGEEIARTHPEPGAKYFYGYHQFGQHGRHYSAEIIKETDRVKPGVIRNFPDGDYH